jgi:streptogramin lyase
MRVMHFSPVWPANRRERGRRRRASRLACSAVLVAGLLGCVLPQAASAASGFAQSKTNPPYAACPETTSGSPICEAIAVPTVAVSSGEALGSEFQGAGEKGGFDPKDLRAAYELPETGGSEETVAIVDSQNDPYAESDLQKYREKYKVYYKGTETACTEANGCFKKIDTNGETEKEAKEHSKSFPTESSNALEISLDIDMVAAACAECHILLVESLGEALTEGEVVSNNLPALEEAYKFTYKYSGKEYKTTEISNSWDVWEGSAITEAEQKSDDEKYLDHPGVPITFASGDYGYSGQLRWPGSSRYVISAGATKLTKVEKPKEGERAWTEEPWREYIDEEGYRTYVGVTHGAGTTSGCSKYEPKPEWQKDKEGCAKRADVDAAVVGACDSPVSIYDTDVGGWYNECGTSDSAPFLAGVEAISTPHSRNLGAQAFYIAGENKTLYDITKGGNGECGDLTGETFTKCHAEYGYESSVECGAPETLHYYLCHAQVGYDGPTGWGAPDGPVASGPAVSTEAATSVAKTGASLNGTVDPEGVETKYYFEYDTKEYKLGEGPHGTKTTEASAGAGTSNVKESKAITGLTANTKYDFRIVATNGTGTTYGLNQVFTTLPNAPENITLPVASPETPDQAVPESSTTGTWTNGPTSYKYQWELCSATGGECAAISGATSSTFTPVEANVKHTLVVKVTAKNSGGESAPVSSKATKQIKPIGEITEYALSPGSEPEGIAAGPDGNLWFAQWDAGKIGKITTSGTITEYSLPEANRQKNIVAGPDGDMWFTVMLANRIGKSTTSGAITEYALPANSDPYDITAGPDGNLWFTEWESNRIGKITTSGAITEYALPAAKGPYAISEGPDGNLWFTAQRVVGKITTSGAVTEYSLPEGSLPGGITTGPDKNLWFTDDYSTSGASYIDKITTSGAITEYSLPKNSFPVDIAAGPDENLWFTDHGASKIGRITTSGAVTEYPLSERSRPESIVAGPDDNLWFTDSGTSKIGKITP